MDLAVLARDERLKAFVRDGYEYIRCFGIARIGLFGEPCTVGDMTALAVKLSDAGDSGGWTIAALMRAMGLNHPQSFAIILKGSWIDVSGWISDLDQAEQVINERSRGSIE